MIAMQTVGLCSRIALKLPLSIDMKSQDSSVMMLAERGASSIMLISPNQSPDESTDRITSLPSESERWTFARPDSRMYSDCEGSPSETIVRPRG